MNVPPSAPRIERVAITLRGAVQGVGFRPFVYRLARELELSGWVSNTPAGVLIEAEGEAGHLGAFLHRLREDKPAHASIRSFESTSRAAEGSAGFTIVPSSCGGAATAEVSPDLAVCPECMNDVLDPSNRRYRYPFTNCTYCGPRFTIIESLPYDRLRTTMKTFPMCRRCREEFEDPSNRRFHAQPIACPECGPQLELWTHAGAAVGRGDEALLAAAAELRSGRIVAVKGLGGFHLLADARKEEAVLRLRRNKRREEKPFAVLFPDVASVRLACRLSIAEEALLVSSAAPIVLLRRRAATDPAASGVCAAAAPGNPTLGALLPYTPLHHLLMRELGFPVIATSGNLSEEPICTDEREAVRRLSGIADMFLVHDRPVRRHCDDSVARIVDDSVMLLRRARGYAPVPIRLASPSERRILAVGAHQKNTVALLTAAGAVLSQHIGDLSTPQAYAAFEDAVESVQNLYPGKNGEIACDLHPGYLSTAYARQHGVRVRTVQHHYAHVASCMAEHQLTGTVLGVAWDGTGYGPDGTVWGGEFLLTGGGTYRRAATFRTFPLPGGETAIREPRRSALGLLYEMYGDEAFRRTELAPLRSFTDPELHLLQQAVTRSIQSPRTSSVGRLFDAAASLLGIAQTAGFEGQAAMMLESAAGEEPTDEMYPFRIAARPYGGCIVIDWAPMIAGMLGDLADGTAVGIVSGKFHSTLAGIIVETATEIGEKRVVLTGGCFQNVRLLELAIRRLRKGGFLPYWHHEVPPNDGGIALGQLYACLCEENEPIKENAPCASPYPAK